MSDYESALRRVEEALCGAGERPLRCSEDGWVSLYDILALLGEKNTTRGAKRLLRAQPGLREFVHDRQLERGQRKTPALHRSELPRLLRALSPLQLSPPLQLELPLDQRSSTPAPKPAPRPALALVPAPPRPRMAQVTLPNLSAPPRQVKDAPYGWEWQRGVLSPVPEEQAAIRVMQRLRAFGASFQEIASDLNEKRFPPRRPGRWSGEEIASILERDEEIRAEWEPEEG